MKSKKWRKKLRRRKPRKKARPARLPNPREGLPRGKKSPRNANAWWEIKLHLFTPDFIDTWYGQEPPPKPTPRVTRSGKKLISVSTRKKLRRSRRN
eukprot:1330665-Amorphochlora_amoeboformis.AAC.1